MENVTLSSGVVVETMPFPGGLYAKLQAKAMREHPEPEPPMKEVDTFDGTEEVEDLEDLDYIQAKRDAAHARQTLFAEVLLGLCVQIDLKAYKKEIVRTARFTDDPPPKNEDKRIEWFFENYAFRVASDYEAVTASVMSQTLITNKEVRDRLTFFRGEVEGSEADGDDAPGTDEVERVDVQQQDEGS